MYRTVRNRQSGKPGTHGFTIIEVMIVLTVAALIMLIIFIAVPTVRRIQRNTARRQAVGYTVAQLQQYRADRGKMPVTQAEGDAFVDSFMANYKPLYEFQFRDNHQPHLYIPPYDTISLQYGHWCASNGNAENPGDTIATSPGGDDNNHYYAIWTQLEDDIIYCVDNASST